MNNDSLGMIFLIALLAAVIFLFIRIALKIRRNGGSLTTMMFGATYEFLNKDKREAVEQIVEVKASKKMEEQSTNEPKDK